MTSEVEEESESDEDDDGLVDKSVAKLTKSTDNDGNEDEESGGGTKITDDEASEQANFNVIDDDSDWKNNRAEFYCSLESQFQFPPFVEVPIRKGAGSAERTIGSWKVPSLLFWQEQL